MQVHTPGPWKLEEQDGAYTVYDANDDPVVWELGGIDDQSNARLIAAAPELLELAKLVAQDYEDAADWKDARGNLASMARAALDKAGVAEDEPEDEDE